MSITSEIKKGDTLICFKVSKGRYFSPPKLGELYGVINYDDDDWFYTNKTDKLGMSSFLKEDFIKLDMNNKLIGLLFL